MYVSSIGIIDWTSSLPIVWGYDCTLGGDLVNMYYGVKYNKMLLSNTSSSEKELTTFILLRLISASIGQPSEVSSDCRIRGGLPISPSANAMAQDALQYADTIGYASSFLLGLLIIFAKGESEKAYSILTSQAAR